jgi:hypothetical protein
MKAAVTKASGLGLGLLIIGLGVACPVMEGVQAATVQPRTQTALLNPALDRLLADILLWTTYLSLPLGLTMAIWRYDRQDQAQMAKTLGQIATLERIWQRTEAR